MSQELFDYMLKQHDLILLDTDMHEIKLICNKELIEFIESITHMTGWCNCIECKPLNKLKQ